VDVFLRPDQSFGFEEFRRNAEDESRWTRQIYYSGKGFDSEQDVVAAAGLYLLNRGQHADFNVLPS
jgi:hypothetical protein